MTTEKVASDFFESIKEQLVKDIMAEIRPTIAVELDQRRFNVAEAAQYAGVSEDTIYTLCKEKKIPHYKAGGGNSKKPKILFRVESLDKWMLQQERLNCEGWN